VTSGTRGKRRNKSEGLVDASPDPKHLEGTEILDRPDAVDDNAFEDNDAGRRSNAVAKRDRPAMLIERVESVFRMASLLAISASVVLTAFQFYQGRIDEQKERSVDLMNTWQTSRERDAFARLSAALEERLALLPEISGQPTPAAMRALKFRIGELLVQEWSAGAGYAGWDEDVDSIFNFYSEVEFCIRAGLCDETLLKSYFGDDAISFWEYFRAFAEARRGSFYPDYGAALDAFVKDLET